MSSCVYTSQTPIATQKQIGGNPEGGEPGAGTGAGQGAAAGDQVQDVDFEEVK